MTKFAGGRNKLYVELCISLVWQIVSLKNDFTDCLVVFGAGGENSKPSVVLNYGCSLTAVVKCACSFQ